VTPDKLETLLSTTPDLEKETLSRLAGISARAPRNPDEPLKFMFLEAFAFPGSPGGGGGGRAPAPAGSRRGLPEPAGDAIHAPTPRSTLKALLLVAFA